MAILQFPPEKVRRPGPYKPDRRCTCGAILSRLNPSDLCAPCSGGQWLSPEADAEEIERLRAERLVEIGAAA